MTDNTIPEEAIDAATKLPDALVAGISVLASEVYDDRGQRHPINVMTLLFQVDDSADLAQQHFVLDTQATAMLRRLLKNPATINPEGTN